MTKSTHQKNLARAKARREATDVASHQRFMTVAVAVGIAALVAIAWVFIGSDSDSDPTVDNPCPAPEEIASELPQPYDEAPQADLSGRDTLTAVMTTTCGDITLELDASASPTGVPIFVQLARDGYYDNVPFHRVIDGFMIQGGDPTGTGRGFTDDMDLNDQLPGFVFTADTAEAARVTEQTGGYPRGTLAWANAGGPESSGSQFFIMHADYPLPPLYGVFGRVTDGMDVVDRIVQGPVEGDLATTPTLITGVEIS